jgi:acetylornithine deacetylase/succinyl-diaminopimelate desuccinylase-like protein
LLEKLFKPARTVVLAFGFDEETSGLQVSHTNFLLYNRAYELSSVDDRVLNISLMQ